MDFYLDTSLPEAARLMAPDRFTFSVAARIAQYSCRRMITDHKRLFIVESTPAFPIWAWTAKGASREELTAAWRLLSAAFPPQPETRYNVKQELANIMLEAGKMSGVPLRILVRMNAYCCKTPIPPSKHPGGRMEPAQESDLAAILALEMAFQQEHRLDHLTEAQARQNILDLIHAKQQYVWRDQGQVASICHIRTESDELTGISGVNTVPGLRRQGYASNLVYAVCQALRAQNRLPVLYADADYPASNGCYMQIGFERQGCLCTVGWAADSAADS